MIPALAQSQHSGLVNYFFLSNSAGQLIILALGIFSALAWSVMLSKYFELQHLQKLNRKFQSDLNNAPSLLTLAREVTFSEAVPFSALVREATRAYFRAVEVDSANRDRENAVDHAENALRRAVAQQSMLYERKMVLLASIVTGAPFMGLLGTVWGVMDAFGAIALESSASLQKLAPGVAGALLTTVAGLVVAIPSVFGYNFLLSLAKKCVIDLENFASLVADRIELEDTYSRDI